MHYGQFDKTGFLCTLVSLMKQGFMQLGLLTCGQKWFDRIGLGDV